MVNVLLILFKRASKWLLLHSQFKNLLGGDPTNTPEKRGGYPPSHNLPRSGRRHSCVPPTSACEPPTSFHFENPALLLHASGT